jgi:methionyl-tRNA formyltransferase
MTESVDSGEIIARKKIHSRPDDTANTLYQRALEAEFELFKEIWPSLVDFSYDTTSQSEGNSTAHSKSDLDEIRPINLDESIQARDLIRKLRALTTNDISEAAYFEQDGKRYRIQVDIVPKNDK